MPVTDKFSQRNPLWSGRPLGTKAGSTIGKHGCLLCSATRMIYKLTDRLWTPWELNKALTEADGYANGNLLKHSTLAEVAGLRFVSREDYRRELFTPELAAEVEGRLLKGCGILVQVDSNPFAAGIQEHWVHLDLILSDPRCAPYKGWWVYDPWYGEMFEAGQYYAPYGRKLDYAVWAIVTYAA